MSSFGGFAIEEDLFETIKIILPKGSKILELGSGRGSKELAKIYDITCIEHNNKWLNKYKEIKYIHAPIAYCKPTIWGPDQDKWYDKEIMKKALSEVEYDLLLIDGPPGNIGRCGLLRYKDYVKKNIPIIIDDTHRTAEWKIAVIFSRDNKWNIWTPSPTRRKLYSVVAPNKVLLPLILKELQNES